MTTRKIACAFLMVFALLLATTRLALAWPDQPPDKALISGAGLTGEVEITDPDILKALKLGAIEDFEQGMVAPPQDLGEGYRITRYFYDGTFNFGVLHYYPNPAGGTGYVRFEDGPDLQGNHTQYNGQWFHVTPEGEAAMQRLFTQMGAQPASTPVASGGAPVIVSLLAAIGGVLLITWLVQSRTQRTRVAESAAD
jgi:hypothetical protein